MVPQDSDIPMSVKMNNKCFPDIEKLARGERADEGQILEILDFIDRRYDCADFRLVCVLRSLCDYSGLISEETLSRMKRTVLGFKYAMDEPGRDSMCYWSENHQLIFAACEYLAGQLYPEETFTNNGRTGRQHMQKAQARLERWFEERFTLGFTEWHSNTYYEEDAAPLSLLIDCARDPHIASRAAMLLDLLLLDMALHSFEGGFSAASGRCYERQKKDPKAQDTLDIAAKAFGLARSCGYDYTRLSADFIINRRYRVPPVIPAIARSSQTLEVWAGMGLSLKEVAAHYPDPHDMEGRGMYLWGMEAFTTPESVSLTLRMFRAWKLKSNIFLKDLAIMDIPVLRQLGLLPLIIRLLNPVTRGIAIQRANTYTFRTKDYMLSTAVDYHPGSFGDQQHIWQASLPGAISVFTTHPGAAFFEDNARNFSPSYWVGNGIHPHAAQHRGVGLCLYDLRARRGLLEKKRLLLTHAFFPLARFDETLMEKRLAAGRAGNSYIALLSLGEMEMGEPDELIQRGKVTGWAVLLGSRDEWGSFERFLEAAQAGELRLKGRRLSLEFGDHRYEIIYQKRFLVDGQEQAIDDARLRCAFISVPRDMKRYEAACGGHRLTLDWQTRGREII